MLPSTAQSEHSVPGAWAEARAAAQFAALISVNCATDDHNPGDCPIARVARDGASRALAVVRELADTSAVVRGRVRASRADMRAIL